MDVNIYKYTCIEESTQDDANAYPLLEWRNKELQFVQNKVPLVEAEGKQCH